MHALTKCPLKSPRRTAVCILSNDSRVGKSDERLMSASKVFVLHAGSSSSLFPFKKHAARQFKQNLCLHFHTFIGFPHFCVFNIIQFHFRWNTIRSCLRRKEIKKNFEQSSCWMVIYFNTLPFDGGRHDRIILLGRLFLGCIYGLPLDIYIHKIYFFNFVFIASFSYCDFLSQKLTTDFI